MDPISQGALGAIAAATLSKPVRYRWAVAVGWVGGMLADADIFIRSESDPLLNVEYHRHFSHSLVFILLGGLICAGLLWIFLRRLIGFRELLLYATAGYATAGLLDACTSYGTQLLWPFQTCGLPGVSYRSSTRYLPSRSSVYSQLVGYAPAESGRGWGALLFWYTCLSGPFRIIEPQALWSNLQEIEAKRDPVDLPLNPRSEIYWYGEGFMRLRGTSR